MTSVKRADSSTYIVSNACQREVGRSVGVLSQQFLHQTSTTLIPVGGPMMSAISWLAWLAKLGKRPFPPTIYGVLSHDTSPKAQAYLKKLISNAYRQGARSIVLELSPSQLQEGSDTSNDMTPLAKAAHTFKGMRVIPAESDELWEEREVIDSMRALLSDRGGFDRDEVIDKLSRAIWSYKDNILADLRYASPPARKASARALVMVGRLEKIERYFKEINYDIDRFGERWYQTIVVRFDEDCKSILDREKPDLVFIGYAHAKNLSGSVGAYRTIIVPDLTYSRDSLPSLTAYPHLETALKDLVENFAVIAYQNLITLASDILNFLPADPRLQARINQAISKEPDLLRLALRANYRANPVGALLLVPRKDLLDLLRMDILEARQRVKKALLV